MIGFIEHPLSGVIHFRCSLQDDFSLRQEKCDKFFLCRPSNAEDVLLLALRSLNALAEQPQPLSCDEGWNSKAQESAARLQALEHQVVVHSADLTSARSDMTPLEESITVTQRQSADAQSLLVMVEWEC